MQMIGALMLMFLNGPTVSSVVVWQEKITAGELVADVSRQTGTPIQIAPSVAGLPLTAYFFGQSRDEVVNALCQILDVEAVRVGDSIDLRPNADIWEARLGLEDELDQIAKSNIMTAYRVWKSLPLTGNETDDQAVLRMWGDAEMQKGRNYDDQGEIMRRSRLRSIVMLPAFWPMSYVCSQMDEKQFSGFMDGRPALASTSRIQGVQQVFRKPAPNGNPREASWVFYYDAKSFELRMIRHMLNSRGRFVPYSDREYAVLFHQIETRAERYPSHLRRQAQDFEPAQLNLLEYDPAVKAFKGPFLQSQFWYALARNGKAVLALWSDQIGFQSSPDLGVIVDGIIVVKPRYHWRKTPVAKDYRVAMPSSLFKNSDEMMTVASRMVLDGSWQVYQNRYRSARNGPPGDFHYARESFAQFWLSLNPVQTEALRRDGLSYAMLGREQRNLFLATVFRGMFNTSTEELPLKAINPRSLSSSKLLLTVEAIVAEFGSNPSSGSGGWGQSLEQALRSNSWPRSTRATEFTTVNVGYKFLFELMIDGRPVLKNEARIYAEVGRGSDSERKSAFEKFVHEHIDK